MVPDKIKSWKSLLVAIGLLCGSLQSFASQRLDEVQEMGWSREFYQIYQNSKTAGELLEKLPTVSSVDIKLLSQSMKLSDPLPKLELTGHTFIFDSKTTLKVISLNDMSFSINGKSFRYNRSGSSLDNLRLVDQTLNKKNSAFLRFFLRDALAADLHTDMTDLSEMFSPIDIYSTTASVVVGMPLVKSLIAGYVFLPVHYMVTKAEAAFAPSCQKQVSEIKNILASNNLGLADINCDKYSDEDKGVGEAGKSVTFWTSESKIRKFNADWVNGLAWDDPTKLYLFNRNELIQYRELNPKHNPADANSKARLDYKKGTAKFEEARRTIEPYRQVLKYLGENRSCYKCHKEIKKQIVSAKGPSAKPSTGRQSGSKQGAR